VRFFAYKVRAAAQAQTQKSEINYISKPEPKLNGQIYSDGITTKIWWIDGGLARWIVDEATYHGVFGGSPNKILYPSVVNITEGANVADGTELIRGDQDTAPIYLVNQGTKRFIPTEAIKSKYQLFGNVHTVAQSVVSNYPDGPIFT